MNTLLLRAHHLLCIQFFKGSGYDVPFVQNIESVIRQMKENPEVLLVDCNDAICRYCPNGRGKHCIWQRKVEGYDLAVMEICGLKPGKIYRINELIDCAERKILKNNLRRMVCGDCEWNSICGSYANEFLYLC